VNDQERRRWPDGFDDDALLADIVAHLNDEARQEDQEAQDQEANDSAAHLDGADGASNQTAPESPTAAGEPPPGDQGPWPTNPPPGPPSPIDPQVDPGVQVWRAHEVDDEFEEHFEPPPVTPLPAGDLQFWAIIAGMTGGPLLLLYLVFFNRDASSYWIMLAIAMSVGGFALLVSRMPGKHDDDDDGARL
jgi:hypothetical protein